LGPPRTQFNNLEITNDLKKSVTAHEKVKLHKTVQLRWTFNRYTAKDTTTGAKCKAKWVKVCRPEKLGGIEFARALRLRWPWQK
jgi:hypothetical protein